MDKQLPIQGEIIVDHRYWHGVSPARSLKHFVEKHVWRWARSRILAAAAAAGADHEKAVFHVRFDQEVPGHVVNCHLEVRVQNEVWMASEFAGGAQRAFLQCLQHLTRVQRLLKPVSSTATA